MATAQKKQKTVDHDFVYRQLCHQRMSGGRRGAYARTGRVCDCSDELVRQIALAREKQDDPDVPLEYTPAPGQPEYERQLATDNALLRQLVATTPPTEPQPITSTPNAEPLPNTMPMATPERETPPIISPSIAKVIIVPYGGSRARASDDALPWLVAQVALTATLCVLLTAASGSVVAFYWIPFPLVLWWAVARLRADAVRRLIDSK